MPNTKEIKLLLPCPFCGSSDTEEPDEVICMNCFATADDAEAWNTRASQWISVKDSLPEVGQLVLVHTPGLDSGRHITEIRLLNWFKQCEATHWQPIEPPLTDTSRG